MHAAGLFNQQHDRIQSSRCVVKKIVFSVNDKGNHSCMSKILIEFSELKTTSLASKKSKKLPVLDDCSVCYCEIGLHYLQV